MKSIIKQYLAQEIELIKRTHHTKIGNYWSISEFIYKNGEMFQPNSFPKNLRRGNMKECYRNATLLVIGHPQYSYVEGYAMNIIPTMHAWCIDKKGKVIDPTWNDGKEYFGVAFNRDFLFKSITKAKRYGLIDSWQEGWPLLKLNKKIWKR